jgi:hypothetical protein
MSERKEPWTLGMYFIVGIQIGLLIYAFALMGYWLCRQPIRRDGCRNVVFNSNMVWTTNMDGRPVALITNNGSLDFYRTDKHCHPRFTVSSREQFI